MTTESSSSNTSSTIRVANYELGQIIGVGNFSIVKFARHIDTGEHVAFKILDKKRVFSNKNISKKTGGEILAMEKIRHQNVVRMYEMMSIKTKVCIAQELVTGGELFDKLPSRIGRFTEPEARKYFQQLISAVEYCHSKGVSHRNLKPENLLLDADGMLKVSDFGLSTLLPQQVRRDGLLRTTCGSPQYMAPEVISNLEYETIKSDIWSCGVILFALLSGNLPFNSNNSTAICLKAIRAEFTFPSYFSPSAKRLITRLLDPNPATRISINEILEDQWFKDNQPPTISKENTGFDDSQNPVPEELDAGPQTPVTRNAFHTTYNFMKFNLVEKFFKQVLFKRETRFRSKCSATEIISTIEHAVASCGFHIQNRKYRLKIEKEQAGHKYHLLIATKIFEVDPPFYMVEFQKAEGDTLEFEKFYNDLSTKVQDIIWKEKPVNAKSDGGSTSTVSHI